MLDADNTDNPATSADTSDSPESAAAVPAKKAAKKAAAKKAPAKKAAKKATTKKTAAPAAEAPSDGPAAEEPVPPAKKAATRRAPAKKAAKKATTKKTAAPSTDIEATADDTTGQPAPAAIMPLFKAPETTKAPTRRKKAEPKPSPTESEAKEARADTPDESGKSDRPARKRSQSKPVEQQPSEDEEVDESQTAPPSDRIGYDDGSDEADGEQGGNRRRRRRGGRRRRKGGGEDGDGPNHDSESEGDDARGHSGSNGPRNESGNDEGSGDEGAEGSRRRRRRRRTGEAGDVAADDPEKTVTRVRKARNVEDEITSVTGSTRLEAKKQRRREGREAGRRRAPIVSEAEFLARREAVDRVMVIRQKKDLTQIAVLEDKVLVEHYVARESQTSLIGNVYLARVQNVLPSMEAAFLDIGKGRNAVLYAGEVNWSSFGGGSNGGQRKIEQVLKPGQSVLVQVSKDPIGHKGARLTSQISLPGRFLVYVPDGTTSGISRKLPDTERSRLKTLLKEIVPDSAGVIVRTAAEGASEEELTLDVERLTARWEDIESKVKGGNAPQLLYGEPDLTLKVVRDLFTEDFGKLVVSGDEAWDMVDEYVKHVAPDLEERLERYDGNADVFAAYRVDEQIAKGLDRKVWLPSGGSLVIDRTEAMTVVDVNTGKFTGSGGNLEETVTKNNLEAAEEIVRQLRLRDIGGIIVVDFIDMVLESNRDLVLRRMVECLGRDRTRHQVAEVTSLGLVQMTRKRIGTGLLEAFSENCEQCQGRGVIVHLEPVEAKNKQDDEPRRSRRGGRGRDKGPDDAGHNGSGHNGPVPSPKDVAAMAKPEQHAEPRTSPAEEPLVEVAQPEQTAAEPAQPRATTRRVRARRPAGAPDLEAVVDEQAATDLAAGEPTVVDTAVADPVPVPDASIEQAEAEEVAAPRVVTTTRRRVARRPAGRPVVTETATAEPVPESAPQEDVEPAAPTIVTTTRRRGASRPAGPPQEAMTDGTESGDVLLDDGQPTSPHVPVKKKGSRKH